MSNEELLSSISDIVEAKLEPIKQDIHGIKEEVGNVKEEVGNVKEEVGNVKEEVGNVKEEVSSIKDEVSDLQKNFGSMTGRMDSLEKEVRRNSILIENEILPRLRTIEKIYVDSSRMFMEKAVQIDGMQDDIDAMKVVIQEHSEKLEKIS